MGHDKKGWMERRRKEGGGKGGRALTVLLILSLSADMPCPQIFSDQDTKNTYLFPYYERFKEALDPLIDAVRTQSMQVS